VGVAAAGLELALITPQWVTMFAKRGKSDRNDAEGIDEAAEWAGMARVPVKSADQQANALLLSVREMPKRRHTQLVTALGGHAARLGRSKGR
jgi:transposase